MKNVAHGVAHEKCCTVGSKLDSKVPSWIQRIPSLIQRFQVGFSTKSILKSKLRRFFDYFSDRPEFNLELVLSSDQDDLVAKNKGR